MGGKPMYQEGIEVPEDNYFGAEPVQGSLAGAVTLQPTDADYPLLSIPTGPTAAPVAAQTNSIYDYLVGEHKDGSYAARKAMAQRMGIKNYTGTAAQNIAMLKALKSGSASASQSVVTKTPAGKVTAPNTAPTGFDYTDIPGAGFGDNWDEHYPAYLDSSRIFPDGIVMDGSKPKRKAVGPAKPSIINNVTKALTGSRSYEEYAKKNPYFANFLGVNDKSSAFVKGLDAIPHYFEDQMAKAIFDGDPGAIGELLTIAAMGRGSVRTTRPGRRAPGYEPTPELPAGNLRIPGATGNTPVRVPRGFTMPNRGVGNLYGFEDGGEMMAYGGQIGYGLDLNTRRVYTDMPEEPGIGRTLAPVSPEDATYEAEKGEVLIGDPDKDGTNETLVFGGKRHSQGGTPANEPGFIYSDTKKMTMKGPVLEEFGKTAGKSYTPAEIAKQYDLTKYKAVMDDPNADDLQKKTAQIMYENYERKLAKLAAVQESMKGFPQGLPEVTQKYYPEMAESVGPMQYMSGGFTFQKGGTPNWLTPWTKSNTVAGRMSKTNPALETTYNEQDGNTLLEDYNYWKSLAGRDFTDLKDMQAFAFNKLSSNNKEGVNEMLGKYGHPAANTLADGILGRRSAWMFKQRLKNGTAPTPGTPVSVQQTAKQASNPGTTNSNATTTKTETQPAADTQLDTNSAATKLPYNAFDVMNVMEAVSRPVKSYGPRMFLPDVQQMQGVYDTPDYNPYLSANNTRAQMNNTFGNAGAAMAANTYNPELLQGIMQESARVRGTNMQTANQMAGQNTQITNQNNMLRSQLMGDNYDKWVKTQEETDIAEKMKWRQDVAPAVQNMQNNWINMQRFNMMYPQYAITGPLWNKVAFQGNGYNAGQKAPQGSGNDMETFLSQFPGMKALYASSDPAKKMQVEQEFLKFQNQKMVNMARNPRNMYLNRNNAYNPAIDDRD